MSYNTVYFCTSNPGKFNEVKRILEPQFSVLQIKLDLDELQSTDTEYVCSHKIKHAIAQITETDIIGGHSIGEKYVLLVEDTGLEIANMNGFPGALVKFYLDYLTPDGICKFNAGSAASMHVTMVAYLSDTKEIWSHTHKVPGLITDKPKGYQGFGFDSVFECTQHPDNLTLAQMMPEVKKEYSARSECAIELKKFLQR
jgi:non-canonical purine NTP pyrophosphatase (RdgB/HAM1 family)